MLLHMYITCKYSKPSIRQRPSVLFYSIHHNSRVRGRMLISAITPERITEEPDCLWRCNRMVFDSHVDLHSAFKGEDVQKKAHSTSALTSSDCVTAGSVRAVRRQDTMMK